jgi:hypothetical protein
MPNYREFFITREGYKDYLTVRVYKTCKAMHIGSKKTEAHYKYKDANAPDAGAFFIASPVSKCKKTYCESTPEMYGIILLNEENLTNELIAHECLHAALAHERLINRYMLDYYKENGEEERLCWYFQWLYANVIFALKDEGFKIQLNIVK